MNLSSDNALGHQLSQLLANKLQPFARRPIFLALSGGMDSMLMLYILNQLPGVKDRLTSIHVNHRLSENADTWQDQCQQACDELSVPLVAKRVMVKPDGRGIEAAARDARYAVFEQTLPSDAILLMAHHASDQAETLLIRLMRGSGLAGLGAMHDTRSLTRNKEDQRLLLRPWLGVSRGSIEEIATTLGMSWVEDESNNDESFNRNWIRRSVLPLLQQRHPAVESRLNATALNMQADYQLLQQLIEPFIQEALSTCELPLTGNFRLSLDALQKHQPTLQAHLIRQWLQVNQCALPEGEKVWHWLEQCISAAEDKMPACPHGGVVLQRYRRYLYVVLNHPDDQSKVAGRKLSSRKINVPLDLPIRWAGGDIELSNAARDHAGQIIEIRPAADCIGMKVQISGRPLRTLKQTWQEQGIPPWLREYWPVVVIKEGEVGLIPTVNMCSLKCELIELLGLEWRQYAIGDVLAQ